MKKVFPTEMKFIIFASVPPAKKTKRYFAYGNEIYNFCIRSSCKKTIRYFAYGNEFFLLFASVPPAKNPKNDIIKVMFKGLTKLLLRSQLNITSLVLYRFFRGALLRFASSYRSLRSLNRCSGFALRSGAPPTPVRSELLLIL